MSLPGYDTWLLPRERSGWFDVRCTHKLATCAACGHTVAAPKRVTLYEPRKGDTPPLHLRCLGGDVLGYTAATCPACGSDEYGVVPCDEEFPSKGHWQEGAGVELVSQEDCPRCHSSEHLEVEPCDPERY